MQSYSYLFDDEKFDLILYVCECRDLKDPIVLAVTTAQTALRMSFRIHTTLSIAYRSCSYSMVMLLSFLAMLPVWGTSTLLMHILYPWRSSNIMIYLMQFTFHFQNSSGQISPISMQLSLRVGKPDFNVY